VANISKLRGSARIGRPINTRDNETWARDGLAIQTASMPGIRPPLPRPVNIDCVAMPVIEPINHSSERSTKCIDQPRRRARESALARAAIALGCIGGIPRRAFVLSMQKLGLNIFLSDPMEVCLGCKSLSGQ
jgi:hypothetical protein